MSNTVDIRLPKLRTDQRSVFYSSAQYRSLMCGRRWGKTTGLFEWMSQGLVNGLKVGWVAPDFSFIETPWNRFVRTFGPVIEKKDSQKHRLYMHGGGEIHFWSSANSTDPGRGEDYDRLGVDEAGLMRHFQSVLMESLFPTLADRQGRLVVQGTPKGAGRDFVKQHEVASQGENGWAAFSGKTIDNPLIDRAWIENARRVMTLDQFRQEFEGIPAEDGGNPFGIKAIQRAIGPLSASPAIAWGVDLGSTQDWTVIVGLDANGSVCYLDRFQADWETISNRIYTVIGNSTAYVDQTGVGKPVVERLQLECYGIEGFTFTNDSKHGLMSGLAAAFQLGEIRITDDADLVRELESFGFSYTDRGRVRYEAPPGMHDDCVCALALAWQCYKDNGGEAATAPLVSFSRHAGGRVQRRGVRSCL